MLDNALNREAISGIKVILMVFNGKQFLLSALILSLIITGCSSQWVNSGDQNDKPNKSSIPIIEDNKMQDASADLTEGASENDKVDVLETYKNEEYNFSFDIPVLWKGNYRVIQKDNRISFVHTGGWPGCEPEIFAIMVMTEEEFKKANTEPPSILEQDILGRRNNLVFFCIISITVPIPTITSTTKEEDARKFSEEWGKLFRALNNIPKRFHLEYLHSAFGRNRETVTGCTREGVKVWHIGEVVIFELLNTTAKRKIDSETGFELLEIE